MDPNAVGFWSPENIQLLKDFQTALVGLIGFAGVIITLAVSARAARAQHIRTAALAIAQHQREIDTKRRAIRTAILEELHWIERVVMADLETYPEGDDMLLLSYIELPVFEGLMHELGLLDPSDLRQIFGVVAVIRTYTILLSRAGEREGALVTVEGENACAIMRKNCVKLQERIQDVLNELSDGVNTPPGSESA